ncbi:hypothetical protein U2F10_02775 [Leptothoe sp. EHU-05/26/07-4]
MVEVVDQALVGVRVEIAPVVDISIEEIQEISVEVETQPIVDVLIESQPSVEVSVEDVGGTTIEVITSSSESLSTEYQTALGVAVSHPSTHKEFTYTDGDITRIDVWADETKLVKLFTKTFTYSNDGDLFFIDTINEQAEITLTKTFVYVNEELTSISEIFS